MITLIGYILFGMIFIALPIALILFLIIVIIDFIDDIKFNAKNK